MYERVSRNKPALQQHLDDPVIEYIHLRHIDQVHYLSDLPRGKYIVCGDATVHGKVFQSNCFETVIDRLDNNSKYNFRQLLLGLITTVSIVLDSYC